MMGFEGERVSCNNNNNRPLVFFERNPDPKKELFCFVLFLEGGYGGRHRALTYPPITSLGDGMAGEEACGLKTKEIPSLPLSQMDFAYSLS